MDFNEFYDIRALQAMNNFETVRCIIVSRGQYWNIA